MSEIFRNHLAKFIEIDEQEFVEVMSYFRIVDFKKKENLLEQGEICKFNYFVLSGCLRKFFINDKGVETTTHFAIEQWWITDGFAFEQRKTTEFYIQAVEHSEILMVDLASFEELLKTFPKMERYFRFVYQRAAAAAEMRIKYLYDFSKEDYYHHFNDNYPEFVQRIPQYLLASFLGLTPEYLSEVRKKNRS